MWTNDNFKPHVSNIYKISKLNINYLAKTIVNSHAWTTDT